MKMPDGSSIDTELEITLEETNGKTRMTILQSGFPTPESRDAFESGWPGALERLAGVVHAGSRERDGGLAFMNAAAAARAGQPQWDGLASLPFRAVRYDGHIRCARGSSFNVGTQIIELSKLDRRRKCCLRQERHSLRRERLRRRRGGPRVRSRAGKGLPRRSNP